MGAVPIARSALQSQNTTLPHGDVWACSRGLLQCAHAQDSCAWAGSLQLSHGVDTWLALALLLGPLVVWPLFLGLCAMLGLDILDYLPESDFKAGLVAEGTKKGFVTGRRDGFRRRDETELNHPHGGERTVANDDASTELNPRHTVHAIKCISWYLRRRQHCAATPARVQINRPTAAAVSRAATSGARLESA